MVLQFSCSVFLDGKVILGSRSQTAEMTALYFHWLSFHFLSPRVTVSVKLAAPEAHCTNKNPVENALEPGARFL